MVAWNNIPRGRCSRPLLFLALVILPLSSGLSPPPIIACKSTSEVQRAIDIYVKPNDVVLELGAQLSDTSAHLCRAVGAGGRAVLVDVKRKVATSGRSIGRDASLFVETDDLHPESITTDTESFVDRTEYHELEQFDQWRELVTYYRGECS